MRKRVCVYIEDTTLEHLKSLSVDSTPHVSQSAIVEYLILQTQEVGNAEDTEKRNKKTNKQKEVNK